MLSTPPAIPSFADPVLICPMSEAIAWFAEMQALTHSSAQEQDESNAIKKKKESFSPVWQCGQEWREECQPEAQPHAQHSTFSPLKTRKNKQQNQQRKTFFVFRSSKFFAPNNETHQSGSNQFLKSCDNGTLNDSSHAHIVDMLRSNACK